MTGGGVSNNPLLDFQLRPLGTRQNWTNVLNKQRFEATLQQHREPADNENLRHEVTQALHRAINHQIDSDGTLELHSTVHFTMQSNTFTHEFQSATFPVREFKDGSDRLDTYLCTLAAKLNSNEEFALNDSFTLEMTFIHTPGPRSGNGNRYKASDASIAKILKRSIITIKNNDALCCARAIVTMRAYADAGNDSRDRDYHNLKQGYLVQEHHPCKGKWCHSCERKECPDFIAAKQARGRGNYPVPQELCRLCHWEFHGTHRYNYHLQRRGNNKTRSVCDMIKKCPNCRHVYRLADKYKKIQRGSHPPKNPHQCWHSTCPNCEKDVNLFEHKCFIQRLPKREDTAQ